MRRGVALVPEGRHVFPKPHRRGEPHRRRHRADRSRRAPRGRRAVADALPDPRRARGPARGHALGRGAAAARDRAGADVAAAHAAARRAVARPRADLRRPDLRADPGAARRGGDGARSSSRTCTAPSRSRTARTCCRSGASSRPAPPTSSSRASWSGPTSASVRRRGEAVSPSEFVQQLVNALSLGSIYALLALGLSMVYGVLGMLNFAYGELVTIAGYSMLAATYAGRAVHRGRARRRRRRRHRVGADGADRLPPAAERELRVAAVHVVRGRAADPGRVPPGRLRPLAGHPGAGALRRGRAARPGAHRRAVHHHGVDRRDLARRAHDVHAALALGARDARRVPGLHDRAAAGRPGEPRDLARVPRSRASSRASPACCGSRAPPR